MVMAVNGNHEPQSKVSPCSLCRLTLSSRDRMPRPSYGHPEGPLAPSLLEIGLRSRAWHGFEGLDAVDPLGDRPSGISVDCYTLCFLHFQCTSIKGLMVSISWHMDL